MFYGRYGNDQLNRALGITSIAFAVVNLFMGRDSVLHKVFLALWLLCFGLMALRMFSRKLDARRRENDMFLRYYLPVKHKFQAWRSGAPRAKKAHTNPTFQERRKYKYFSCTQCAQRLRVPRGKGKLRITCTRCGNQFEIKS